ncbi:MAG: DUF3772 domain-containing protein [Hyphomicrobiales bacterium]|nr:MAG: DUF3772 domain-containing protein [Hyphomicrobiales bacterium]
MTVFAAMPVAGLAQTTSLSEALGAGAAEEMALPGADLAESVAEAVGQSDVDEEKAADTPASEGEAVPISPAAKAAAEAAQAQIDAWRVELDRIAAALKRSGLVDKDFDELRTAVEEVRDEAQLLEQEQSPAIEALQARLEKLAPEKKEGDNGATPETPELIAQRALIQKELGVLNGLVRQGQVELLRARELLQTISTRRQAQFTANLLSRSRPLLDPKLWWESLEFLPHMETSLELLPADWWSLARKRLGPSAPFVLGAILLLAIFIGAPVRRFIVRRAQRTRDAMNPPPLRKYGAAAVIVLVNVLLPLAAMSIIFAAISVLDLDPERIHVLTVSLFLGIMILSVTYGLARALLAPGRPTWRMVALSDTAASNLTRLSLILGIVFGLGALNEGLNDVLLAPAAMVTLSRGILAMLIGIIVAIGLRVIANGRAENPDFISKDEAMRQSVLWRWGLMLAWPVVFVCILAPLFGYVTLGWFAAIQLVWASTVLGILFLLLLLVDEAITIAFHPGTRFGRGLVVNMGFGETTIEQIGVILSGVTRLLLILIAALAVLAQWGVRSKEVLSDIRNVFFGFQFGGITFSLSTVLTALVLFIIGIAVTRTIQGWMEHKLLPRTRLDVGLKTSIRTGVGYVGVILAGMFAFSYIGLDLQNIAIVAGALSVGIGFGLQSVVNNFVSGLILLAERPIKTGDWIIVGSEEGIVRRINVRATEIETFDRASVIVPNSDLISGVVKNWMHNDPSGRIIVPIGVSYDSDPEQVKEILLTIGKEHEMVLAYPAPYVVFVGFGDSSLDFQLRCYLGDIGNSLTVSSDIRFAIAREFRAANIEIPFPQRDVNLRDMPKLEALLADKAKPAPRRGRARKPSTTETPGSQEIEDGGDGDTT